MGPTVLKYVAEIPGRVGTLQERLAEVVKNEVPPGFGDLPGRRIAETVENWRRDAEERIRLSVDEMLVDLTSDATRSTVARDLTQKVLRSMDVGNNITDEGVEE